MTLLLIAGLALVALVLHSGSEDSLVSEYSFYTPYSTEIFSARELFVRILLPLAAVRYLPWAALALRRATNRWLAGVVLPIGVLLVGGYVTFTALDGASLSAYLSAYCASALGLAGVVAGVVVFTWPTKSA